MKILVNFILIVLFVSSCNKSLHNTNEYSKKNIANIITKINDKDSLSLDRMISKYNVNSFDDAGVNLLTHGVMTGDLNIVKILVEKGANLNSINKTSTGSTPLMMASGYQSLEIAEYLVEKGADINIQDKNGDPAINWSAYYGNVPFTKLMLDKRAKTDLKSIHSDGVMQVALKEWKDSIVELLLEYDKNINNVKVNETEIINAVKQNNVTLLKSLIDQNNIKIRDGAGNTLLMIAADKGYLEVIEYLVMKGIDIDEINSVGHTALNKAVYFGNNSIANHLIEGGADVNKTDNRFILPPLIAAIRGNNIEIGELLLLKGADINTIDGINNFSPIMWATLYKNRDFIVLLLKYDPDLSIVNRYKKNVFEMTKDEDILKLLKDD